MYTTRSLILALFMFCFCHLCSATLHGTISDTIERVHHKDILMHRHEAHGKRFDNERFTWYNAGQNACGSVDSSSDWVSSIQHDLQRPRNLTICGQVVAMNSEQFDGGSHCYQTITLSYGGKTTQVKVTDECPGCQYGALDLSEPLFSYFAPTSQGVIYGEWNF
ncbi:expansin-like protein [Gelatoporia subvermispora B]|uniref:Expansin-like protein n=1 Tax=Ceriporiopsis subvermispora (strain B) TaxID=914234 RepID=M2PPX2_CERS8|nr:expansin-like protein [Gelatoporia subvermispora B]